MRLLGHAPYACANHHPSPVRSLPVRRISASYARRAPAPAHRDPRAPYGPTVRPAAPGVGEPERVSRSGPLVGWVAMKPITLEEIRAASEHDTPTGPARLVAWLGGYAKAGRALGISRNVLRYAANPEYRERIKLMTRAASRAVTLDLEASRERREVIRAKRKRAVHFRKPGLERSWCGREIPPDDPTGGEPCKECMRLARRYGAGV